MSYTLKSPIYNEALQNEKRITQRSLEEQQQNLNSFKYNINKAKEYITETKKKLEGIDEKKRVIIYNLRRNMEDWGNHKDDLICNALKEEKLVEYKKEMSKLQELNKDRMYKHLSDIMENERKRINENMKFIRQSEKLKLNVEDHAIERGRKTIISKCIDIIRDNRFIEANINYLQERINEIDINIRNQTQS